MLRLKGFGVRNLRALRDTGIIDLKPITILVGKNSAGKSSFARVLPLLKQSAERRKQGPLLWFGRLVDFGSFDEAISSFASEGEIELLLRFATPPAIFLSRRTIRPDSESNLAQADIDIRMILAREGEEGRTVLRSLHMNVFGVELKLTIEGTRDNRIYIDGKQVVLPTDVKLLLTQGTLLPMVRLFHRDQTSSSASEALFFQNPRREKIGTKEVRNAISEFVHGNTQPESKDQIADRLPITTISALLTHCLSITAVPDTWRYGFSGVTISSLKLIELQRALILNKLDALLIEMDEAVQLFCGGVSYLEPLRATVQRYYRREEVSIDELDPKGLNTTFFIQGLTVRERDSLNEWLRATFGFSLLVKTAGGHSSLNIETDVGGQSRNMADVGSGYSQLTPVAIQLWAATRRLSNRPTAVRNRSAYNPSYRDSGSIVVVEQPELHLHPAYQAKLADVFVGCVNGTSELEFIASKKIPLRIVAETHSPNLINRLGELIGEGQISANDVQVLVFEPDSQQSAATSIRTATFDEKGILHNWPIGFFEY